MIKVKKDKKIRFLLILSMFFCFFTIMVYPYLNVNKASKDGKEKINAIVYHSNDNFKQLYLSDIEPIQKRVGYGSLAKDTDLDGNSIILTIEGHIFTFKKGLFAHADATLVYDLNDYSDYNYFTTFVGLNNSSSRGNGVTYHFYTSLDNSTWTEVGEGITKNPRQEATFVSIPLNGVRYLKLEIDDNGANGNDHSVFADAKLVNDINGNFVLDSAETFDSEIKTKYNNEKNISPALEHLILKRDLVKKVGQYTINSFYNESEYNKETIDWLLNNSQVLKYYILGGTPDGNNYYNSLTQLSRLYHAYKNDFDNKEVTRYGTVLGDLYTRMAIALSLTHSQRVALWMQPGAPENQSDAVVRYQIFKELHKNDKFKVREDIDITKWYENYNVEEMRFIMNNLIDDESILWLNEYVQSKIDANPQSAWGLLTPHPYMAYVWPNYGNPVYYDNENYKYFNDLFAVGDKKLFDYDITRGTNDHKVYKVWMNFRNKFGTGAVCGGISKSGSNIRATHGIAATVIGQPGHAALLYYSEDSLGRGYWNIDNDVSGWTLSEKGERMLLGWGNASYSRGSYQVVYMALAQEVLNDYDNFAKAEELIMLSKSYVDNPEKQEELLREAIAVQPINIDAWYELIMLYNNSNNKSENAYFNLAEELAESLKYFPLPMYQLTNLIKPKLTSIENSYKFALLQTRILNVAQSTPNNTEDNYYVYQPGIARGEANFLLGKIDNSIATFSFDGFNAGKIVLSNRFDGSGIRWDYSIDGKKTWNEVSFTAEEPHVLTLSNKQINSITAENDIYVHIVGVNYDEKNLFKIDIKEGQLLNEVFANDLENRMIGVNLNTEWRYKESDSWNSYNDISPDLTGNKTIQIRQAATGTTLASDLSEIYKFTEDNQPNTRKYIPVSHISIHSVSTEATSHNGAAIKAIDGNYYTRWHSAWNGSDQQRFFIVKLDKPVYLSAVEFVPAGGGNGKIYDGTIYGSMDGENWEELATQKNLTYKNQANTIADAIDNTKNFEISDVREVQYVKIVADRTNGNWFTARAFNFYQDLTKDPRPTAGVAYSTTEATNEKVVARLINPSSKITITNNNGSDTFIFTENGEFTFEFVDELGRSGSAIAKVDWIDKSIPEADVNYELDTDHKIIISLDNISEDVYLLDKNDRPINFVEVKNKKVKSISYLDAFLDVYKTVYVDEDGNISKIAYKNTTQRVDNVKTYVTIVSDGVVTGEEFYDDHGSSVQVTEEDISSLRVLRQYIANPLEYTFETSGDYEYKLLDTAKNIAYKSIKIDYTNDTIIASDITYDITSLTNKDVVATINPYVFENNQKKDAIMLNGSKTYVFKDNGEYTFKYINENDNDDIKEHKAQVTWIDKKAPTAQIKYSTTADGKVIAKLINENETIIITNNGSSREYVFSENGEFIFEFVDVVGNKSALKARVDWIKKDDKPNDPDKDKPIIPNKPDDSGDQNNQVNPSKPNNNSTNVIKPNRPNNNGNGNNVVNPDDTSNTNNNSKPGDNTSNNSTSNSTNNNTKKDNNTLKDETHNDNILIKIAILFVIIVITIIAIIYVKKPKKIN